MKFTLSWLKEHLDTTADAEAIAAKLTAIGLEVEGIEDKAKSLAPFTVAYVRSAEQHPNADKLRVCMVDTGKETLQIVCGAPNARAGLKVVFAPEGSTIPGTGLHLKPATIRGVASNGMMCSEREMGLSQEHDGIIELPADAPIGAPFAEIVGLADPVIEIKLTPNRGDCAGVHGIARDLAAAGEGTLKSPAIDPVAPAFTSPLRTGLQFAPGTENACPLFAGRMVRGLTNRASPDWLQRRLKAVGLRPISALVDVTNLLSLDRARPLHVFDADKIKGALHARLAREGETLAALDGKTYALDAEMCVIADDSGAVGIAGVMGGEQTGCTEATRNVYIEAALFDPIRIAATGRKLGIISDARYRFERGVDPTFCLPGLELATRLILDTCGGEASDVSIAGAVPEWRRTIPFDPARVLKLTGLILPAEEIVRILRDLGFEIEVAAAQLNVTPPPWRPDVHGDADIVEEIVRIAGFARIPSTPLPRMHAVTRPQLTALQRRVRDVRRLLAARGLTETVNNSFLPRAHAALFGGGGETLQLENPISADLDAMRPSLLTSLLAAAARNEARSLRDFHAFEIGPQFSGGRPGEQLSIAAGLRKGTGPRHWAGAPLAADAFAVKGDVLAIIEALGGPASIQITADAPAWYHPGRSGTARLGPKNIIAHFGELHPLILSAFAISGPLSAFEFVIEALPFAKPKPTKARPPLQVSDFQPVERDFAFILDARIAAAEVIRAAQGADKTLIDSVSVFDLYEGAGVGLGKKSIAIAVRLQPADRTLTEPEIDAISQKVIAAVVAATGGQLRA
ncbi:MAG: phenylalanine--tRNA ligase subunit beta [Alphaproteobacteria bacterium]|nr:phenylalanine--tRNA ligase subunit beta [Alphaproteobacteria bacterium]